MTTQQEQSGYAGTGSAEPAPVVSAVICTRNRPNSILQAVSSVLANDHPSFDLTIIDQSTDDATKQALVPVAADPRLQYIHTDQAGLSRAYNTAIARTSGHYLAFTDDDCIAPREWISSIVGAFEEEPEGGLLYGQVVAAHGDPESTRLTPALVIERPSRLSRRDGFRVFGMGANFAARRELLDRIGGFDEALGGGGPLKSSQDYDLAYRTYLAGSVILLRPEVTIRHDGRREAADWPSLLESYGFGDGAFYAKHVRCRDSYALWLLARRLGFVSSRHLARTLRRRHWFGDPYIRGMARGIRASTGFSVNRRSKLYAIERTVEVDAGA